MASGTGAIGGTIGGGAIGVVTIGGGNSAATFGTTCCRGAAQAPSSNATADHARARMCVVRRSRRFRATVDALSAIMIEEACMPRAPQHEAAPTKEGAEPELTKQQEGAQPAAAGADPQAAKAGEKDPAGAAPKSQLQLLADAWVRLVSGDQQTSWGFWPVGKFSLDLRSLPGEVHSPDDAHSPTAMHTYELDAAAAEKAHEKAEEIKKSPPDYNLFNHNCVWFATTVAQAAGITPPNFRGLLGIANPNAMASALTQLNK